MSRRRASERREELSAIAQGAAREDGGRRVRGPDLDHAAPASSTAAKSPEVETAVSEKRLRSLNEELLKVPDSFTIHRKLRKPLEHRLEILEDGPIEYGHAEALAFASLLTEGTHIRLTGQDTERGTFSHRHLVLHDEKTGLKYAPIQNLSGRPGAVRAPQQPAVGDRLPRLRVRLLGRHRPRA